MKIQFNFAPGTRVETQMDPDKNIIGISIEPFFPSRRGTTIVANGFAINNSGEILDQVIMSTSGVKGAIDLRKRNKSAKPYVDMTVEERAEAQGKED